MSYILEALRKSQQEREMTQVPAAALEDLPGAAESAGSKHWLLATMLMAVVAVAISLYAVIGSRVGSAPEGVDESSRTDVKAARRVAGVNPASVDDQARPPPRSAPVSVGASPPLSLEQRHTSAGVSSDRVAPTPRGEPAPLVATSGAPRRASAEHLEPMAQPARDATPTISSGAPPSAGPPDTSRLQTTALATEQLPVPKVQPDTQGEPLPVSDAGQADPPRWQGESDREATQRAANDPAEDGASGSFRREAELLRDRLLDLDRALSQDKPPTVPKANRHEVKKTPSRQIRTTVAKAEPQPQMEATGDRIPSVAELPAHVFKSLPPRNILVHVYNEAAEKRFVILNSQRHKQGDTTKDGFVIEEIQPDGVVLRFQGERFFNPR